MRISKDFYKVVEAAKFFENISNQEDFDIGSLINGESATHMNDVTTDKTEDNKVQLV